MPEGPFGNIEVNGPLGENKRLLLIFHIDIEGKNAGTYNTPENMNELSNTISRASNYIDRNIKVFRSDAPATGNDFMAIVEPGTAEYWSSIDRSVQNIKQEVGSLDNVRIGDAIPVCDTVDDIVKNNTSGRF